ncbi:MAG: transglycosylase SLT domain-containing protein, partial [Selenomonas sp.]|nr:transglycosylase SLT domain-containing protein [Selenomonas sp.]
FRDLMFEFTRLKQEASYALNWVGYYLMKYLQKPLADIREKFKAFNDSFIKNMSVWTEKVARAIYYVIEVGRHLIEFLGDIGKAVYKLWDSFPSGVKKAIAAITALNLVLSAGPLGRSIMLISTLLLLIDDYYGYMEGKNAAFGKYWDKLNEYLEKGKVLWEQLKTKAEPYWNMLVEYAGKAKDWFDELVEGAGRLKKSFDEWMESAGNELLAEVVEECQSLWGILTDIGSVLATTVKDAWKGFNEQLEKNDTIKDVTKGLESLWRIAKMLYKAGKDLIKFLTDLWREVEKSQELREFGAAIMELVDAVGELFTSIMELVETAIKGVFGEMGKTGKVYSFRDAIRAVLSVFTKLVDAVSWAVKGIAELFDLIAKNKTFKAFWETVGGAIDSVISKIGRFSRAMIAFLHKDVEKAKRILMGEDDQERHGTRELSETEKKWEPYIQEYAKKHNVDPNLLRAIIKTESGFNPDAVSPAGAIGMAQFMPSTAAAVGIDPHDPIQSIEGAAMHLRTLIDSFGSERLAIAAYNAGAGAVKKYGDVPPFQETQEYVEKVLAAKHGYESDDSPDAVEPHYLGKAEMESSLENVRWFKELAPWIGGMLKKAGAGDAVYTSGARTLEHQMRINPEAPNSYHVDRGKGGDAVDIDLPDGVDTEAIVEMFKPYFKEVLYHSVDSAGGGLHLHLGGYLGNANLDFKKPADPVPDPSTVPGQEPAWDGPPARPAESSEEDYLPPTESHENDEKSWGDVLTEVRDSVIKGALGDETGQEVIDAANTAKETIGDFIGQIVKNGEDINSEHEEVMGKLEDYVKPTAYNTPKGQATPLGMAQGTPNPADWVGGNAERMRSGVLVPLGTKQFPREPATQIQKKADTSIPVEMPVCLKQTVFLLTEIRKAMPSIGSLLPTLEKLVPKQEQDSPVVPSKPQERPQTDSLSQVTA